MRAALPAEVVDALDGLPVSVIVTDLGGTVQAWNDDAETLFGWSSTEAVGRSITELTVPVKATEQAVAVMAQVAQGERWRGRFTARRRDGSTVDIDVVNAPLFDITKGELTGIVGVSIDAAVSRWRRVVEASADPLSLHSPDGTLLYVSPSYEQLVGRDASDLLGQNPYDLIHPDDVDEVSAVHDQLLQAREPGLVSYRLRRADGTYVWIESQSRVMPDGNLLIQSRSIRARRSLMQALQYERTAAERLRDLHDQQSAFLTTIAHRARHPVTAVLGFSHLLERLLPDSSDPRLRQVVDRLVANAQEVANLVEEVTSGDALMRRTAEVRREWIDVTALAAEAVRARTDGSGVISLELPAGTHVYADRAQLSLALQALVHNAVVHTRIGTRAWIRTDTTDEGLVIIVEDEGRGVPESLRSQIFEPFRHGTVNPADPGFGLGLFVVSEVAAAHGGRAWVEDRRGGGASFRVLIPFRDHRRARTASPAPNATRHEGTTRR